MVASNSFPRFLNSLAVFAALWITQCVAQSWKTYPSSINGYPEMSFPAAEANHPQYQSDTWFITARLRGIQTGKEYQIATIFARNTITAILLNFYEVSIFDVSNGGYVTYTDYDLPVVNLLVQKIHTSSTNLDIVYNSSAGRASWTNARDASGALRPFVYDIHLPGTDSFGSGPFSVSVTADMLYEPLAFGADVLKGVLTVFGEPGTFSYSQTRPKINGTLTFKGVTEPVEGTLGHLDRQWFPLTPLFWTPTGRQRSHEWRQINLDNGVDMSIWQQFDRTNNNTVRATTGTNKFQNGSAPLWVDGIPDLTVEYFRYRKFPRSSAINTLIPPPSPNMYFATKHIVRSAALGMELMCTYVSTETPAVNLVIEYFEGPAQWEGILAGQSVSGNGIFESTFALYRHWELVDVLYDSVAHLPDSAISPSRTKVQILQTIASVRQYVSSNLIQDNRVAAGLYISTSIIPALRTLNEGQDKMDMLTIAMDFQSSLSFVLQF